jgi:1-acyl-sn-glycerol-3-phosphate acyltransferase
MTAALARGLLALLGWRIDWAPPPGPRCVVIVYPHTSNWDFPVGYLAKLAIGLRAHWMGKDALFRWPVAGLLRRMGGIPVNRSAPGPLVEEMAAELRRRPRMVLALAPEGTRSRADHWRSGFYRLALTAGVPVGLAYVDWGARRVGLTTWVTFTGDEEADLALIRAGYAGKVGKLPDQASPIRLRAPGVAAQEPPRQA